MAHHKSALKRIRQTEKRRLFNRKNKKALREALRAVRESKTYEEGLEKFKLANRLLDKISMRGIIHKNNAAHKKSGLARLVNNMKVKAN